MAQYNPTQENVLNIKVQYYNELDIQGFSQMLKDPSFCYKFYWLEDGDTYILYGRDYM